ncbi:MAG: LysE family translocator [Desulfobacteraceae bacterium]|nr:LysE family translocator [Desulfobacteraceae bacterium]
MDVQTLISFLITTAIVVVIPGPNIMLITNNSIQHGFGKGVVTVIGISTGMILLFSLSLAGISTLLIQFSWIFDTIKFLGVLVLLYLGITQIRDSLKINDHDLSANPSKNNFFIKGFLISASNPKGLFFAGAFFPQFLNKDAAMTPQILILCGGCLLVATIIGVLYAFFAKTADTVLNSKKFQKGTGLLSGAVLIFFATALFFTNKNILFNSQSLAF